MWGGIEHEHEWTNDRWYAAQGNAASSAAAFTEAGPENAKRLKDARWHDNNTCACGAWLGSLGLEPTPELFIEHLVECFREVKRVLRPDGTCWINLGDSYAGSGNGSNDHRASGSSLSKNDAKYQGQKPRSSRPLGAFHGDKKGTVDSSLGGNAVVGLAAKNLMLMPFRVALALQQDGWILRSVIPWLKRSAMPESVNDRPSTAVEYVFLLAKSSKYFWDADAVRTAHRDVSHPVIDGKFVNPKAAGGINSKDYEPHTQGWNETGPKRTHRNYNPDGRNIRNTDFFFQTWQGLMLDEQDDPLALVVNPTGFSGAHFATFPTKLVEPMVKASTSEKGQCPECGSAWVRMTGKPSGDRVDGGTWTDHSHDAERGNAKFAGGEHWRTYRPSDTIGWGPSCAHNAEPVPQTVLDPFGGAGTVGLVTDRLGRNAVLCELKESYAEMGNSRIVGDAPLFVEMDGD